MPKKKYHDPQDDVVKIMDGERVPVKPYDMYAAMHEGPKASVSSSKSAGAESPDSGTQEKSPANTYFVFDGQNLTLVENKDGQTYTQSIPAVSGRKNPDGTFSYSKDRQNIENVGPIPEGVHSLNLDSVHYIKDENPLKRFASVALDGMKAVVKKAGYSWNAKIGNFPGGDAGAWGGGFVDVNLDPEVAQRTGRKGITVHGGIEPGSAGCIDTVMRDKEFFSIVERLKKENKTRVPLIVDYSNTPEKVQYPKDNTNKFRYILSNII